MQFVSSSLAETRLFAEQVVSILKECVRPDGAVVLTLSGDLGAGKTSLVQCIASVLGVRDPVVSPTFILRSDYPTTDSVFSCLSHFDAYRLDSAGEIVSVGFMEVLSQRGVLVALEWPERVLEHVPSHACSVSAAVSASEHTFTFSCPYDSVS